MLEFKFNTMRIWGECSGEHCQKMQVFLGLISGRCSKFWGWKVLSWGKLLLGVWVENGKFFTAFQKAAEAVRLLMRVGWPGVKKEYARQ